MRIGPVRLGPPLTNIILFVLTVFTTLIAGAFYVGANPFENFAEIYRGIPFSASLITILLSHEMGHYFVSMRHHVRATLPYFIPAPPYPFIIGTLGAVIRMKSPILSRKALVDIGAAGPIIGFIFAVAALITGLPLSDFVEKPVALPNVLIINFGDSIAVRLLSRLVIGPVPEGMDMMLHPIAFAGWIGLFVTSLNLIPVGQLDGGHVAFAFLGPKHRIFSRALIGVLLVMGLLYWSGWLLWAALLVLLGLNHPPVHYWETPLDPKRKLLGALALLIFVLTFTPSPFTVLE
jgi:membrane-associated protease RseP (regulator of RpoE activity)